MNIASYPRRAARLLLGPHLRLRQILEQLQQFQSRCDALDIDNSRLRSEAAAVQAQCALIRNENSSLQAQFALIRDENSALKVRGDNFEQALTLLRSNHDFVERCLGVSADQPEVGRKEALERLLEMRLGQLESRVFVALAGALGKNPSESVAEN